MQRKDNKNPPQRCSKNTENPKIFLCIFFFVSLYLCAFVINFLRKKMKQKVKPWGLFLLAVAFGIVIGGIGADWILDRYQPKSQLYRIKLPPATTPTEAAPQFILDITITDSQTGRSVRADVLLGETPHVQQDAPADALVEVCHQVTACRTAITGRAADHPTNVQVIAPGYQRFSIVLRHNLERSRTLTMPVRLIPAQPQVTAKKRGSNYQLCLDTLAHLDYNADKRKSPETIRLGGVVNRASTVDCFHNFLDYGPFCPTSQGIIGYTPHCLRSLKSMPQAVGCFFLLELTVPEPDAPLTAKKAKRCPHLTFCLFRTKPYICTQLDCPPLANAPLKWGGGLCVSHMAS